MVSTRLEYRGPGDRYQVLMDPTSFINLYIIVALVTDVDSVELQCSRMGRAVGGAFPVCLSTRAPRPHYMRAHCRGTLRAVAKAQATLPDTPDCRPCFSTGSTHFPVLLQNEHNYLSPLTQTAIQHINDRSVLCYSAVLQLRRRRHGVPAVGVAAASGAGRDMPITRRGVTRCSTTRDPAAGPALALQGGDGTVRIVNRAQLQPLEAACGGQECEVTAPASQLLESSGRASVRGARPTLARSGRRPRWLIIRRTTLWL